MVEDVGQGRGFIDIGMVGGAVLVPWPLMTMDQEAFMTFKGGGGIMN
jgi:hypothetical protein